MINLKELEILDLSVNQFLQLPSVIYELASLTALNISNNSQLVAINKKVLQLKGLKKLGCVRNTSVKNPPYAVCQQGLGAVRKYFEDLTEERGTELPVVPLAIVGNLMAGKTSIARSLKAGKRQLTIRQECSVLDEVTEVFQVDHLTLQKSRLTLLDYAGHEIYHPFQLLLIKERCLVMVVVNMEEFAGLSCARGCREATRRMCFDWLSPMYLLSPGLGPPLLALTHVDRLTAQKMNELSESLLGACQEIREELLEEEQECASPGGTCLSPTLPHHLMDTRVPLFNREEILRFSDDIAENSNIRHLEEILAHRCRDFNVAIPRSWELVSEFVDNKADKPYIDLAEIASKFPNEDCVVILRYMHNSGRILWFEDVKGLSSYIFHQMSAIRDMITLLFHHSSEERWKQRVCKFTSFKHGGRTIGKQKYQKLVEQFQESGQLAESILVHLLKKDSKFPPDIALQLLHSFHIIHGPLKQEQASAYIIPYFAPSFMGTSWSTDGELQLRVDIVIGGLSPPKYVHQLLTVAVLNHTYSLYNKVLVKKNGASIYHGASTTHLVHDYNSRTITLQVSTDIEDLGCSWLHLLASVHCVLQLLFDVWKACRVELLTYCAHCLYLRDPNPAYDVDPDWALPLLQSRTIATVDVFSELILSSGVQPVSCPRHTARSNLQKPTIPRPLQFPCEYLSIRLIAFLSASPWISPSLETTLVDTVVLIYWVLLYSPMMRHHRSH